MCYLFLVSYPDTEVTLCKSIKPYTYSIDMVMALRERRISTIRRIKRGRDARVGICDLTLCLFGPFPLSGASCYGSALAGGSNFSNDVAQNAVRQDMNKSRKGGRLFIKWSTIKKGPTIWSQRWLFKSPNMIPQWLKIWLIVHYRYTDTS